MRLNCTYLKTSYQRCIIYLLGSLGNYDDDNNDDVKKQLVHVQHAFQ